MNREAYIRGSGIFDPEWYVAAYQDVATSPLSPIEHYLRHGLAAGRPANAAMCAFGSGQSDSGSWADSDGAPAIPVEMDVALLRSSGLFDPDHYLANNDDVADAKLDPLEHFCRHGWKELRNPSVGFDVWWYWVTRMNPAQSWMNPLVHQALFAPGDTSAGRPLLETGGANGLRYPPGRTPSRVCLFAGYDPDGVVDPTVVAYLRELSRHADVYYLADCRMPADELAKLADCTRGAWAIRHGAYDFGSYSLLARELVGWEAIDRYDELILANDSCYLLRGLDDVFTTMDRRACDWWGLQATKGIAATRHKPANQFRGPIPIGTVKDALLRDFEADEPYDFHLGSYFLAYRRPVVADTDFRRLLSAVAPQASKKAVILKYEIGLTRLLCGKGFAFDTFVEHLHPFHPLYSETHFSLIEQGLPLFKRYLLTDNHYRVPGLFDWKQRILARVPGADVSAMERNLLRVADAGKLHRSLRVSVGADGVAAPPRMLDAAAFEAADRETPKFDHWWAFPVCAYDSLLTGNERAVFEEVRTDPSLKKIVLTRRRHVDLDGENVVVVPLDSAEGQYHLLRSRQIFVKHSPSINAKWPLSPDLHNFINLWHGIPLKRFGYASLDMGDKLDWVVRENRMCRAVISSSQVDTLAMAAAFYPLTYRDVWATGLPRNDFVLRDEQALPSDFRSEAERLRGSLRGRRLVLFCPTFKNAQADGYYPFQPAEVEVLRDWLRRNDAVLGVREHMADKAGTYSQLLAGLEPLDLSTRRYPNIEVLYRAASLLITDYSSCALDFSLTGRPVISFAYDYERYTTCERGLFYDLEHVFPGPVCKDFEALARTLDDAFDAGPAGTTGLGMQRADYERRREIFFDHLDDANGWRVVSAVKSLYVMSETVGVDEVRGLRRPGRSWQQIRHPIQGH